MECYIKSEYNNKYLDEEKSSIKWGAKVIASEYHGGPSQKWFIQGDKIFSVNSKHELDIRFGEEKGRQIIQWDSNSGSNQKWYLYEDGTILLKDFALKLKMVNMLFQQVIRDHLSKSGNLLNVTILKL